jgi:hypothetical protein
MRDLRLARSVTTRAAPRAPVAHSRLLVAPVPALRERPALAPLPARGAERAAAAPWLSAVPRRAAEPARQEVRAAAAPPRQAPQRAGPRAPWHPPARAAQRAPAGVQAAQAVAAQARPLLRATESPTGRRRLTRSAITWLRLVVECSRVAARKAKPTSSSVTRWRARQACLGARAANLASAMAGRRPGSIKVSASSPKPNGYVPHRNPRCSRPAKRAVIWA